MSDYTSVRAGTIDRLMLVYFWKYFPHKCKSCAERWKTNYKSQQTFDAVLSIDSNLAWYITLERIIFHLDWEKHSTLYIHRSHNQLITILRHLEQTLTGAICQSVSQSETGDDCDLSLARVWEMDWEAGRVSEPSIASFYSVWVCSALRIISNEIQGYKIWRNSAQCTALWQTLSRPTDFSTAPVISPQ